MEERKIKIIYKGKATSTKETFDGKSIISVTEFGHKSTKQDQEVEVAYSFMQSYRPDIIDFKNDIENSEIDVICMSGPLGSGDRICVQVTKLDIPEFWKELSTNRNAEKVISDISDLVKKAIDRKIYDIHRAHEIILLLDCASGINKKFLKEIKTSCANLLKQKNFKEVWLIGASQENNFRIW